TRAHARKARALFPAAPAAAPSSNAARPGKLFAQPWSPRGRADLLQSTSALSSSCGPVVQCLPTSSLKTEASVALWAPLPALGESPAEIPCRACDLPHPGPALRSLKDWPRFAQ